MRLVGEVFDTLEIGMPVLHSLIAFNLNPLKISLIYANLNITIEDFFFTVIRL